LLPPDCLLPAHSQDPTIRLIGSEKIWESSAALTSRLQSLETELLTQEGNLRGQCWINQELIAKAEAVDSPQRVVVDMESTEIQLYGQQENSTTAGTSGPPVITRCYCSTGRGIVWHALHPGFARDHSLLLLNTPRTTEETFGP